MLSLRIIVVSCALVMGAATSNRIECDPNAAMDKGCWYSEYTGQWTTVKCAAGYSLTMDLSCVADCGAGKFLLGSTCANCASNCESCFGANAFQCSACASTHELNAQRICSLKCAAPGEFGKPASATCSACHSTCADCFDSHETTCTACAASDTLRVFDYAKGRTESGYCLQNVAAENSGFFRQYPTDRMITECPAGCTRCKDRFYCTACNNGYFLYPPANSGAQYALCMQDR